MNISLEKLIEYIQRDPRSWGKTSFMYAYPKPEIPFEVIEKSLMDGINPSEVLRIKYNNAYIVLGSSPQNPLLTLSDAYIWIADISLQYEKTCNILKAITEFAIPTVLVNSKQDLRVDRASVSILVVEDDPMTSRLVAGHLKKYGNVTVTSNYRQATANYMVNRPDLIFLDIHYKDEKNDGFDVMQNLATVDANVFVVMFSGDKNPITIFKCLSLGAQGFITKPFKPSDFSYYLDKFIHSRQSPNA